MQRGTAAHAAVRNHNSTSTLVVVIEEHLRYRYRREHDPASGYDELVIDER